MLNPRSHDILLGLVSPHQARLQDCLEDYLLQPLACRPQLASRGSEQLAFCSQVLQEMQQECRHQAIATLESPRQRILHLVSQLALHQRRGLVLLASASLRVEAAMESEAHQHWEKTS